MKIRRKVTIGIIVLAVIGVLRVPILHAVTAAYNQTVQIVDNSGNVINGVASATTALYNQTVRVVDSNGNVINSFGLNSSGATPSWATYFGDGNEGAATSGSETLSGEHWYTTFNCTGTVTSGSRIPLVIRATTSITLGASCVMNYNAAGAVGVLGYLGGAGGGSGGGTAGGTAGSNTFDIFGNSNIAGVQFGAGTAGNASGGAGVAGSNDTATAAINIYQNLLTWAPSTFRSSTNIGGGAGAAGGSSGGAGGTSGAGVLLIAPIITITAGAVVNVNGGNGTQAAANTQGAGSGGGGGVFYLAYETLVGSVSAFAGGGAGGACTQPSVLLTPGADDTTGTGASVIVTGLTTGGLDATKMTLTAGSGYAVPPTCTVVAGTSSLTGTPACHTTLSGNTVGSIVVDTPGSGGTLTTYTTCGIGGQGGDGDIRQFVLH